MVTQIPNSFLYVDDNSTINAGYRPHWTTNINDDNQIGKWMWKRNERSCGISTTNDGNRTLKCMYTHENASINDIEWFERRYMNPEKGAIINNITTNSDVTWIYDNDYLQICIGLRYNGILYRITYVNGNFSRLESF